MTFAQTDTQALRDIALNLELITRTQDRGVTDICKNLQSLNSSLLDIADALRGVDKTLDGIRDNLGLAHMTDKHTIAAQCWALIEEKLTGILADDRLDAVRAECIRVIADAIDGKKLRRRGGQRARGVLCTTDVVTTSVVSPTLNKAGLGLSSVAAKPSKTVKQKPMPILPVQPVQPTVDSLPARQATLRSIDQGALTRRLEQLLQQSTMGYSGDDEVGYG